MAKIVISGTSNCHNYANCELLADKLERNLPDFVLTKVIMPESDWDQYSSKLAKDNGWPKMPSPIIWRELVDKGGMGTLIGGARDFQEYVHTYYGQTSDLSSQKLLRITADNERFLVDDMALKTSEAMYRKAWKKMVIVGAECPTASRICMLLGMKIHKRFENKMKLNLFPAEPNEIEKVNQLKTILEDAVCPGIHEAEVCDNIGLALDGVGLVVILDVVPRRLSQTADGASEMLEARGNWLNRRYHYLYKLGQNIAHYCNPNVKVLVAGSLQLFGGAEMVTSPINFDVHTLHVACNSKIATRNIVGLPRALEYRLKAAIARQLGVRRCDVVDLIVWGNIDNTFHVDVSQARVYRRHGRLDAECGPAWFSLSAYPLIFDHEYLQTNIIPNALEHIQSIEHHRSALCHAAALLNFIEQWHFGQVDNEETMSSLVIASPGLYSVPSGVPFSFPVTMRPNGCFEICQDIPCDENKKWALEECVRDTLMDWAVINPIPLKEFFKPKDVAASEHQISDYPHEAPIASFTICNYSMPTDRHNWTTSKTTK